MGEKISFIDLFGTELELEDEYAREQLADESATRAEDVAVLEARMDTFTALPAGSTAGDAELMDIRVGADGVTYPNAGDAVRGQIDALQTQLSNAIIVSKNLFDKDSIIQGKTLLGSSGHTINDFEDSTGYCVSNIIDLEGGATYSVNSLFYGSVVRFCEYNANGDYVGAHNGTLQPDGTYQFTVYDGSVYGRFQFQTSKLDVDAFMLVKGTEMPSNYASYGTTLNPSYVEKQIDVALNEYEPTINTNNIINKAVTKEKTDFIVHNPETNYIDKAAVISGKIINANGVEATANGWCCTDFIELESGKTYYKNDYVYRSYWGFYDTNKALVYYSSKDGDLTNPFVFPNDAVYARFSFQENPTYFNGAYVSENSGIPKAYDYMLDISEKIPTEYEGKDICTFNKVLCIGDSLTFGGYNSVTPISAEDKAILSAKYSYPTTLEKITGVQTTNKGDSGKSTSTWYSNHSADDLSGHDCCIIELGTNDGTWSSASETAMTNIINKVKTENNNIIIFVSTIPCGLSYNTDAYKEINSGIKSFVEGLNDDKVVLLDEAQYGHLLESSGYNAGHLSAYGYYRLAQDYANYISWHMNTHRDKFRFIQFIGTNYNYL